MPADAARAALAHAAFAGVLAAAVLAGRATRPEGAPLSLVWPAAAVGVLWLATARRRRRHQAVTLALVGAITGGLTAATGGSALAVVLSAASNVGAVVVACAVHDRLQPEGWYLGCPRDLAVLLAAAAAGAVGSAPTVLVLDVLLGRTAAQTGSDVGLYVMRTFVSILVGVAVAVRLARLRPSWARPGGRSRAEVVLALAGLGAAYGAVFWVGDASVTFLLIPLSILVALRYTTSAGAAHLFVVGVAVVVLTVAGHGPYGAGDPVERIVLAQAFIAVVAFVTLLLTLHRDEREYLISELDTARREALRREDAERAAAHEAETARDLFGAVLAAARTQSIIGTDPEGRIRVFNAGAERLLGYAQHEVLGSDYARFHDPEELARRARELGTAPGLQVLVAGLGGPGSVDTRDWTYVRRDGSRRRVAVTVSALQDAAGRRTGYLGVADDVTDRRRQEAALLATLETQRQAVERLQEVDRVKTTFVASISHELRTPITSIIGYVDMLKDGLGGELSLDQAELLRVVERNSVRLMTLIEDLLTLSHIESGAFTMTLRAVDLRDTVGAAREALRPTFATKALELRVETGEDPVVVRGDTGQLERALLNLLTNAMKFTPEGGTVTVRLRAEDGLARLEVADTGMGISPEDQARLFQRFFRSHEATARAIQGTGLGLSIVEAIVAEHDGDVSVASELGAGTTFTVRLPLITRSAGVASLAARPSGRLPADLPRPRTADTDLPVHRTAPEETP